MSVAWGVDVTLWCQSGVWCQCGLVCPGEPVGWGASVGWGARVSRWGATHLHFQSSIVFVEDSSLHLSF